MSHTSLVNVDADVANKLTLFIAELSGENKSDFAAECEANKSQLGNLLQIILSKTDLILALENEKDAESCFQTIVAVLQSGVSDSDEREVIKTLIERLLASDNALLVLRIFVSVFNLLQSSFSKFQILKAMLSHAIKNDQSSLVAQFESNVSKWATAWSLTVPEQQELYLLMANTLFAAKQDSRALFFLTQHLNSFQPGEAYPQEVVKVATRAVVTAITAPVSLYKDRHELHKTLAGHTTTDSSLLKLIELLRIYCEGTVDTYIQFYSSNNALFNEFSLSHDTSLKNMRLLGLCVLAARSTTSAGATQELSYSDIAAALDVSSDEEVEEWVVEAISNGLLTASMDQLNRVIVVSRSVRVSFEKEEWVTLQEKLSLWRSNLTGVLDVMKSHQNKQ